MKSSNLAERLEQYEALGKLQLSSEPATRVLAAPDAQAEIMRKPGRKSRRGGIVSRGDGLRLFRVC